MCRQDTISWKPHYLLSCSRETRSSITSSAVALLFGNFKWSTAVVLSCSVENFQTIRQPRNKLWANEVILPRFEFHGDVIKWKHFPCYWPFVRGIHRSPVDSLHKSQWHGDIMFSVMCVSTNGRTNNGGAHDLRRHRVHITSVLLRWISVVLEWSNANINLMTYRLCYRAINRTNNRMANKMQAIHAHM